MLNIVCESKLNINSFNFASLAHFIGNFDWCPCEGTSPLFDSFWSCDSQSHPFAKENERTCTYKVINICHAIHPWWHGWFDFCISYDQSTVRKNMTITSSLKSYCNNVNSLLWIQNFLLLAVEKNTSLVHSSSFL